MHERFAWPIQFKQHFSEQLASGRDWAWSNCAFLRRTFAIRGFIHQLERSRDFVVVENMKITEASDDETRLNMQLELATFYKAVMP